MYIDWNTEKGTILLGNGRKNCTEQPHFIRSLKDLQRPKSRKRISILSKGNRMKKHSILREQLVAQCCKL